MENFEISNPQLLFYYAQPFNWQVLIGQGVTHTVFGDGIITSVNHAHLTVCFDDKKKVIKTFTNTSLLNIQFFNDSTLPNDLDGLEKAKQRLLEKQDQEIQQHLENEKKITQRRLENEKRLQEKLQQEMQQRLENQRRVAEQNKRREEEQTSANEFRELKAKYQAQSYKTTSLPNALHLILLCIDEGEILTNDQITWLESNHLYDTLAIYHQNEYQKTKNPWELIKASGYWRKAGKSTQAIELTSFLIENHKSATGSIKSAIFTTRGGAFRDLKDLLNAEQCAKESIKQNESFHSYNLLGSIYFERGEPEQGEEYFNRAIELGAQPKDQEYQMQNALKNAGKSETATIAQFLLQRDPKKYHWAKHYLKEIDW
jgi:hypothetical protein